MDVTAFLFGLSIVSFTTILVVYVLKRHRKFQLLKQNNIPGPKPSFITGNLNEYNSRGDPNVVITDWLKKYGDICGFYYGEFPFVVVKDLELLKKIFIKDFQSFVNRPKIFVEIGIATYSIFAVREKRWKEIRSLISPMFTSGKLKLLNNMVLSKVDFTVDLLKSKAKSGEMFDLYGFVQKLTLDVIGSAALALKMNCQKNSDDDILKALRALATFEYDPILNLCISFEFLYRFVNYLTVFSSFNKDETYLNNHLESVINERKNNPDLRGTDFMQVLIDRSKDLNEGDGGTTLNTTEILANANALFLAGYETTSTSLAFTFYLLTKYPEVQERLYDEVRNIKNPTCETIQSLPYLDQVYSEALRIYPPVTLFTTRTSSQDYQTDSCTIPKGSEVVAPVWAIHHDPDLWPDPWKFDPDRFSPENKGSINSMAYMPFGIGPRNCVGARMAQMEAKTTIFKLVQNLKFERCSKFEESLKVRCPNVVTIPANGVWVKTSLRTE